MTDYICTHCSYVGQRKKIMRGSRGMEIFLWTVLFFPGPIYTIWRLVTKKYGCPQCGEFVMVPVRSKVGKQKSAEIDADISPEALKEIPDMWREDREAYAKKQGLDKVEEKPVITEKKENLTEEELREIKSKKENEGW